MVLLAAKHTPAYLLHALDLGSLTDTVTPQLGDSFAHASPTALPFNFNATYQRQRPALLLANGNVYAGFGSFLRSQPEPLSWMAFGVADGNADAARVEQPLRYAGHFSQQLFSVFGLDVRIRPINR